jgi:O-antigen ligase
MEISGTEKINSKYTQVLFLGIFIIVWSSSSHILFNTLGKYLTLFIGLVVTIYSSIKIGSLKKNQTVIFFSIFIYLVMLILAFINHQKTIEPQLISFSIIALVLFICGIIIDRTKTILPRRINQPIEYSILCLVILTSIVFYFNQTSLLSVSLNSSRQLGEDQGNAVGIAYTFSLLVIFTTWIFTFEKSFILKFLSITAIISALSVIVITLSRGAIIYLLLLALTLIVRSLKSRKSIVTLFTMLCIIIVVYLTFGSFTNNDLIQIKFEALTTRFDRLFENSNDQSVEWRKNTYAVFVEEWPQFIFGQWRYTPYPHNQLLEIIMRWGIFGVPLIIVLFVSMKKAFMILIKRNKYPINSLHSLFAMLLFFCFFQSMSSLSLEMNRLLWFGYGFFLTSNK